MRRLLGLSACLALAGCPASPHRAPDVILVTLDTTRADHLGVYSYERDVTPSIDRFARDAVTFDRAWATAAWTLPTHASMFTGKSGSSHGARFDRENSDVSLSEVLEGDFFTKHRASRLPESETTLAEVLGQAGYATAAFTGSPWLAPPFGLMQGFEVADAGVATIGGRSAEELTDRAIRWLESVPRDRPLHLFVNYFDPHAPYDPPPGYDNLPGVLIPIDPEQDEIFINGGRRLTGRQRTALIDRYDGEIRFMDAHLGRLLDALRAVGRYDGALVVVVADHGELFGEHGFLGHGRWLYEGVLRIPLLVRFPDGRGAGTREDALVSQVDLMPMIATELGLTLPAGVEGRAIGSRRLVLAEAFSDPFSVSTYGDRYDRDLRAVVHWPWKRIRSSRGELETFELEADPEERTGRPAFDVPDEIEAELEAAVNGLQRRETLSSPSGVSPELEERLRKLGYIE